MILMAMEEPKCVKLYFLSTDHKRPNSAFEGHLLSHLLTTINQMLEQGC